MDSVESSNGLAEAHLCLAHGGRMPYCTSTCQLARDLLAEKTLTIYHQRDLDILRERIAGLEAELHEWRTKRLHGTCEEERLAEVNEQVRLRDALFDMVGQFAHEGVKHGVNVVWTGGLSALEHAFEVLNLPDPCPQDEFRQRGE